MFIKIFVFFMFYMCTCTLYAIKVVSLTPYITHVIIELGKEGDLVGCTTYCMTNMNVPVVADALNANIERIAAIKPDYVLAGGLTHPRIISSIEKMGIKCVHMAQPSSFDEMCEQMRMIGKYLECEGEAVKIETECRKRMAQLKITEKKESEKRMFLQLNTNPLYTILGDSFLDDFIRKLGGESISKDLISGQVSPEFVLGANPDVIIVTTMGGLGKSEVERWKQYKMLKAVKNKKVLLVDEYALSSSTPLIFVKTLEQLYQLIYEQ